MGANMMTKIFLIDSDTRRRAAICHSLHSDNFHVEPFESEAEIDANLPRVGALVIHDDGERIAKTVERMSDIGKWLPIIGFAEQTDVRKVVAAMQNGASDYLAWPFSARDIVTSLNITAEYSDGVCGARLREVKARSMIKKLTQREREVLTGVADGLSNRLIAERLSISPRTVEIHRANMLGKIGASHSSEAIRIAIEASLSV